ncbi:MAG: hypothetical protein QY317_01200 [Candidatus Jettenia caeni]|nr:MAG: hypothetical protein QY317_01200 [Candidatus Jettenia caeni]
MHKVLKMLFLAQVITAFMVFAYTISTSHAAEELIPENPEGTAATNDDDELLPENPEETATTNNEDTIPENAIKDVKKIRPAGILKSRQARIRTPKQMETGETTLLTPGKSPEGVEIPFRPTINDAEYKAAKSAISAKSTDTDRPEVAPPQPLAPPVLKGINIEGVNQNEAGGFRPPDTHGAVGKKHFVEITNSHLDIYTKTGSRVKTISLASFFGYTLKTIFDPRCVYDKTWNRWIITAEAFPETTTVQRQLIAVSLTDNPLGSFYIYKIDINTRNNDDFWDFPQLGMDQDSIIITANIFGPTAYRTTRMFAVAKALLYNGLGFSVPIFSGLKGTLAPPIVLDQNNKSFLVAAVTSGTTITKYTLENSSRANPTLTSSTITVPSYSLPPNAQQPNTTALLDTSDSRFINASTQSGNSLWQVHTINSGGLPKPKFYEFNTSTNTVAQSGFFSASANSNDWNATITANTTKDVYVIWSSTKQTATTHAQVRFSGRRSTDPAGVIPSGSVLFQSTTFYKPTGTDPERWGDYSAVTVDPINPLKAWIVNEKINTTTTWGSRIGQIGF